jgi:hypothetical protein
MSSHLDMDTIHITTQCVTPSRILDSACSLYSVPDRLIVGLLLSLRPGSTWKGVSKVLPLRCYPKIFASCLIIAC